MFFQTNMCFTTNYAVFFKNLSFYNELYTVRLGAILGPFWHREGSMAEPSRAGPGPGRAEPSRAEPSRAEPSRAEPGRAEPSRAGPSRAEPSRAIQRRSKNTDRAIQALPKKSWCAGCITSFLGWGPTQADRSEGTKRKEEQTNPNTTKYNIYLPPPQSPWANSHPTLPNPEMKFVTPRVEFVFV